MTSIIALQDKDWLQDCANYKTTGAMYTLRLVWMDLTNKNAHTVKLTEPTISAQVLALHSKVSANIHLHCERRLATQSVQSHIYISYFMTIAEKKRNIDINCFVIHHLDSNSTVPFKEAARFVNRDEWVVFHCIPGTELFEAGYGSFVTCVTWLVICPLKLTQSWLLFIVTLWLFKYQHSITSGE